MSESPEVLFVLRRVGWHGDESGSALTELATPKFLLKSSSAQTGLLNQYKLVNLCSCPSHWLCTELVDPARLPHSGANVQPPGVAGTFPSTTTVPRVDAGCTCSWFRRPEGTHECVSDFPQEIRWDLRWDPVTPTPLFLVPLLIFQDIPFSSQPGHSSHLFHRQHSSTLD